MHRWLAKWHELSSALVWALSRFPVTIVALAVFALYVNLLIANIVEVSDEDVLRAGVALVGAAAIATSAVLFGERVALGAFVRHLLSLILAAAVGLALWYWERLAISFPALFVAAALTIPLAPYLRRERHGFWAFIWLLTHAVALAFITIIVFCLGLSAIFATVDYLFGVDVDSSVYGHIWSLGLGFVGPLFALSLVPTKFPEADAPDLNDVFVAGLRIISDFVAVPLLAVYVVILHVYALKILIEQVLPKGQIGWMVLSFGLSVLLLRIVAHPLLAQGGCRRASSCASGRRRWSCRWCSSSSRSQSAFPPMASRRSATAWRSSRSFSAWCSSYKSFRAGVATFASFRRSGRSPSSSPVSGPGGSFPPQRARRPIGSWAF
jgi:hypothetical protein